MKLGNVLSKPWYLKLGVFVVLALLVFGGFWYLFISSTRAETQEINDKIAVLLPKNAQAQIAKQRLGEFQAAYKARQQEYEELKALLPEQRELTTVLQGVQDRARSSSLSLRRFSPKDDFQQDFYNGKKIEIGVNSSFAGLRSFFEQMAHYQRIVSITNFEIKQVDKEAKGKTVDAKFDMTAYYVSAEKLQKSPPAVPVNQMTPAQAAQTVKPAVAPPNTVQ